MSGISGFPSNQKNDLGTGKTNNFATIVPSDPFRNSLDTTRFLFRVNDSTVPRTVAAAGMQEIDGVNGYWVNDPTTPARRGDVFRAEDGRSAFIEIPIANVSIDGNYFLLSITGDMTPEANDDFFILRSATQRVDQTGSQIVVAVPGPTQYIYNGVAEEVELDQTTPANSRPLPVAQLNTDGTINDPTKVKVSFVQNGVETLVGEDSVTPGNNTPLPVKLTSVTGDINITAGDLNVHLSDKGANPDITRIGDGTNELKMNGDGEATVYDAKVKLSIDTLINTADDILVSTNSILAKTPSSLVPEQYDEVSLTYVGASLDGEGQISTVTYKLATVTIATLTFSYNTDDKMIGVVRS